jgi:hypothetical protein
VDGLADPQPLWARGGLESVVPENIYEEDTLERDAYFAARFVGNSFEIMTGSGAQSAEELAASGASDFALRASQFAGIPFAEAAKDQCGIIRDMFGNLFRPSTFNPAWRTDTALSLAHQMYESRDFGAMPILADALQDAGCENDDILNHCRDANATHVRGCWVVDLVLGKE